MNIEQIYERMYLIRRLEQSLADYYLKNKVMSFVHFYVGQEATAVGVAAALDDNDRMYGNHRSHGHYLAKGGCPKRMCAELLGKETGCCKGKGGSMHMIDRSVNFGGSSPILGSILPIAAGSAMQQKMNNLPYQTVAFIGDGASEEGSFYETINFAAKFELPLICVVENNLYSVNTKLSERRSPQYDLQKIVEGLGAAYERVNGNNVFQVMHAAQKRDRPLVIESIVYRHMAHSAPLFDDNQGYRQIDTIEERKRTDCIDHFKQSKVLTFDTIQAIEQRVEQQVIEAIEFAEASPEPTNLHSDIYA